MVKIAEYEFPQLSAGTGGIFSFRLFYTGLGHVVSEKWARGTRDKFERLIGRSGLDIETSAVECIGKCVSFTVAGSLLCGVLFFLISNILGGLFGAFIGAAAGFVPRTKLQARSDSRIRRLKADIPYCLDLMTLCLAAGGAFNEALETVERTDSSSPFPLEVGRINHEIRYGRTRHEAMSSFANRIKIAEVETLISSIIQGEKLGTPLVDVLKSNADGAKQRRSERAERAASEAVARMMGPSLLILFAIVILLLGPMVLGYMTGSYL